MIKALTHICLVTDDISSLRDFYQKALQLEPKNFGSGYSEFVLPGACLTLFSQERQEKIAPGSTTGGTNSSMLLEIEVEGADAEFERIKELDAEMVQEPTDTPWHTRSFYFQDPAGNVVNFYENLER